MKQRVVVLISGRGSNMLALAQACRRDAWDAEIVAVLADRESAPGIETARRFGLPVVLVRARDFSDRDAFDRALAQVLRDQVPDLIVLAGFMRILGAAVLEPFDNRIINIHPSLLPALPGLHTHRRALESGTRLHGATVHYVSAQLDGGAIIAQALVPVRDDDDEQALAARVLDAEHRILPMAVHWHLEGRLQRHGNRVRLIDARPDESQVLPPC